ncbi:MAG: hypothetical protein HY866_22820, partial [Chloroflexi bacterium]|nr:hypothetical protein [Chloroflexota bacterium]
MSLRAKIPFFSWGCALLTLAALFTHVPSTETMDTSVWLFYAALVALMLNLGTMLNEDVVSPASTAAIMAYLTLGEAES